MLRSEVLKVTSYGYLAWDSEQERMILAFGTTHLSLPIEECHTFQQSLQRLTQYPTSECCQNQKCFFFKTDSHAIQIVLSNSELRQLHAMLEEGLWLFDILKNASNES